MYYNTYAKFSCFGLFEIGFPVLKSFVAASLMRVGPVSILVGDASAALVDSTLAVRG